MGKKKKKRTAEDVEEAELTAYERTVAMLAETHHDLAVADFAAEVAYKWLTRLYSWYTDRKAKE